MDRNRTFRAFLVALFTTGRRVSEKCNLAWSQVDLGRRTITFHATKTGELVTAYVVDDLLLELAAMGDERDGFVFPWRTRSGVYKWLRPLCRTTGLTFTPHMARHGFATWLREQGHDLKIVMEAGGWSDIKSVLMYSHVEVSHVREAVENLPMIGAKSGPQKSKILK